MAEIKPCPCCGGKADWMEKDGFTGIQYFVECQLDDGLYGCVRQSATYATKREAIDAWNKRPPGIDVDTITRLEVSDFRIPKTLDTKRGKLLNISDCKITIETLDGALKIFIQDKE